MERAATWKNQPVNFELSDEFYQQYEGTQPEWGPIGYVVFKRTYARAIEGESRTEEWCETVRRVVEGTFKVQKKHCLQMRLPWSDEKAQNTAQKMFRMMWEFKFLPPGRGLWMMGTEYVEKRGGCALNNCAFVSTEQIEEEKGLPFAFLMDVSMLGVGCGFDVRGANKALVHRPINGVFGKQTYRITDDREGWVYATEILITSYLTPKHLKVEFDYSLIRPEGSPIKGFGGTASGPGPLMAMHNSIRDLLDTRVGQRLTSVDIVDIMNLIGKCVVAGNVRRTAEIVFGNPDDMEYMSMKQDKEKVKSYRWASNNSIFCEVGQDYTQAAELTSLNGEPGYEWLENAREFGRMKDPSNWADVRARGGNPCLEQTLEPYELCTLVETFPARHDTYEEYRQTLKVAYLYAKTVTLIMTHIPQTNKVMGRNRRIGTSMSGIIRAFGKHGRRETLNWADKGYEYLRQLDRVYAEWLCIPKSIKLTSVKPSGTVSLLPGEPPGIHFPHSEYYIRRVRFNENHDLVGLLRKAGYVVERDAYSPNTVVVEFPIEEQDFVKGKEDASMWEQLENAAQMQYYWADNQVSATITFNEREATEIKDALELYEPRLKGISFLPLKTDFYEQMPYEEITKEEYETTMLKIEPLDLDEVTQGGVGEKFCDGDTCTFPTG